MELGGADAVCEMGAGCRVERGGDQPDVHGQGGRHDARPGEPLEHLRGVAVAVQLAVEERQHGLEENHQVGEAGHHVDEQGLDLVQTALLEPDGKDERGEHHGRVGVVERQGRLGFEVAGHVGNRGGGHFHPRIDRFEVDHVGAFLDVVADAHRT